MHIPFWLEDRHLTAFKDQHPFISASKIQIPHPGIHFLQLRIIRTQHKRSDDWRFGQCWGNFDPFEISRIHMMFVHCWSSLLPGMMEPCFTIGHHRPTPHKSNTNGALRHKWTPLSNYPHRCYQCKRTRRSFHRLWPLFPWRRDTWRNSRRIPKVSEQRVEEILHLVFCIPNEKERTDGRKRRAPNCLNYATMSPHLFWCINNNYQVKQCLWLPLHAHWLIKGLHSLHIGVKAIKWMKHNGKGQYPLPFINGLAQELCQVYPSIRIIIMERGLQCMRERSDPDWLYSSIYNIVYAESEHTHVDAGYHQSSTAIDGTSRLILS